MSHGSQERLQKHMIEELIPVTEYGIHTWGQMYNARQLLTLTTFVAVIQAVYHEMLAIGATEEMGGAVSLYLAFALSRMSLRTSEASRWEVVFLLRVVGG